MKTAFVFFALLFGLSAFAQDRVKENIRMRTSAEIIEDSKDDSDKKSEPQRVKGPKKVAKQKQ